MRIAAVPTSRQSPAPQLPKPTAAQAKRIIAAFNTWAYKREQPSDLALLAKTVERAVAANTPIPFTLYWGKGPRDAIARPDEDCLNYLAGMAARIRSVHARGASIELLLTDTHARLNQHGDTAIDAYYRDIAQAAADHGFTSRRLSCVASSLSPLAPQTSEPTADPATDPGVLDHLTASASKWYGGEGSARCGAIQYYAMNMSEKRAVEAAYPHAIFLTFNNSDFRVLFPDRLPIFYMYSLRKGFAVKPWFIDA